MYIKLCPIQSNWIHQWTNVTKAVTTYPETKLIEAENISIHNNISQGYKSTYYWKISKNIEIVYEGVGQSPTNVTNPINQCHINCATAAVTV